MWYFWSIDNKLCDKKWQTILIISKETNHINGNQSNNSEDSDSDECNKSYDLRKVMSITFAPVHLLVQESGLIIDKALTHNSSTTIDLFIAKNWESVWSSTQTDLIDYVVKQVYIFSLVSNFFHISYCF